MNKNFRAWVVGALAIGAIATVGLNGCTGDSTTNVIENPDASPVGADGASSAQSCTPGVKECVSPSIARVCPADGADWAVKTCADDEKCSNGDCVADANAVCSAGAGSCVNPTTALRCRANLQGFEQVTCPTGTTCS
ncbi:MAG: hypothetical protein ABIP39_05420, partial [Polyangiaceae bacterium]